MPVPESVSPDVVSLGFQAPATDDLSGPDLTSRVRNSGVQPAAEYSGDLLGKLNTGQSSYTSFRDAPNRRDSWSHSIHPQHMSA
jgi:hypothetical protein